MTLSSKIGVIAAEHWRVIGIHFHPDLIHGMIVFVIVQFGARNILKLQNNSYHQQRSF